MAYTSVIPVRRLDRAVKYVMNKEKTTAVSLQDALDYAANRDKTEQSCFESSYTCTLETAFADMRQTKEQWHKLGGVQGYHLVQSFAADEVTPELAHQIAKELAARVLGGRYEYVIGTHLNTGHIHSHIVWNSVSCVDGKKYRSNSPRVQYGRLHGGKPRRKLTGLRALYYRYLYELGALPRKPSRSSYAVRQDAYKLDQRIRQMEFLSKHNIDTLAQLETHRKALQTEIGQLQTKRKQLPKTDDVQSQHESVNTALKKLRQEERLCRKIAEHSIEVQQHLTEARRDRAEQQKQEQERARDRRPDITTR